jgi:hypothetical protein
MSSPLSEEERRLLELMKVLEAQEDAAQAVNPPPPAPDRLDRFINAIGFDDDGKPFALTAPLPSSEEQAKSNREAIKVLEALVRDGGGHRK